MKAWIIASILLALGIGAGADTGRESETVDYTVTAVAIPEAPGRNIRITALSENRLWDVRFELIAGTAPNVGDTLRGHAPSAIEDPRRLHEEIFENPSAATQLRLRFEAIYRTTPPGR